MLLVIFLRLKAYYTYCRSGLKEQSLFHLGLVAAGSSKFIIAEVLGPYVSKYTLSLNFQ